MDDDSEEHLAARLDAALKADLDADRVDVATLVRGTHRRARRLRTRRMVATVAAAVAVVGIPVGYQLADPQPDGVAQPAAMLPSGSGSAVARRVMPSVTPTPVPVPTAPPVEDATVADSPPEAPSAASKSAGRSEPTSIPDSFALTADELPPGLRLVRAADGGGTAIVGGLNCGRAPAGALVPVAVRQWWWETPNGVTPRRAVSLTVTGWEEGDAAVVAKQALAGSGPCAWTVRQTPHQPASVSGAGQTWAATSTDAGEHYGRAVVQIGDGILGVEVVDPAGESAAGKLAADLVVIEAARLKASPLTGSP